ncbi:DNA-directed RNA polymerase III 47 kDa polypeptide [Streptomyces murinus]
MGGGLPDGAFAVGAFGSGSRCGGGFGVDRGQDWGRGRGRG